ncbi:MAG: amino acid racemase [Clostridia bacterium]|nr:amino acid racemase [Clostridia bacterium]
MADIMANKMDDYVIGIVGGMGSYATSSFFERVLDSFPAEKEWERPRIIIDNKCTMPSRVRALLYNENYELLVEELTSSVKGLLDMGATRIVLACNTSHCFLPEVLENVPEAEDKVVNIIEACARAIKDDNRESVFLLATEGTILSKIYEKTFEKYGISCDAPGEEDFSILRDFIEAIKQKNITDEIKQSFIDYVNNVPNDGVILGCTELPIMYAALGDRKDQIEKKIYDPLDAAISEIKRG